LDVASVAVCIITRDRHHGLARCLSSVVQQRLPVGHHLALVVVDNSEDANARPVYDRLLGQCPDDVGATFVHEPRTGIPQARNRALEAIEAAEYVAFIDDDEVAPADWLLQHLEHLSKVGAPASTGPVLRVHEVVSPEWIISGGFFDQPHRGTGQLIRDVATSNVVIRASELHRTDLRFDERFPATGGTDTLFFRRFTDLVGPASWCAEAPVYEFIPPSRARATWLLQRAYRAGNANTLLAIRSSPQPWRPVAEGVLRAAWRCGRGGLELILTLLTLAWPKRRSRLLRASMRLSMAAGTVTALARVEYQEYAR
jgi:succinoglycan biosynthesis protein ExoM